MKIAVVGGTHGNEPVGREVVEILKEEDRDFRNEYQCFIGNPQAYVEKKRYVDCDLNRAFGKKGVRRGYEKTRAEELENEIRGKFDFCIDLHTTTSSMGLTAIFNNTHDLTRKAGVYLKSEIPDFKLIEEVDLDEDCTHLNRLCPAGVTLEVGPVANNVLNADLILKLKHMVEKLLDFDFSQNIKIQGTEYFKMTGAINFPSKRWYVHPSIEGHDFKEIKKGDPIFLNSQGDSKEWEQEESCFPFFINEAAYLEHQCAFLTSLRKSY